MLAARYKLPAVYFDRYFATGLARLRYVRAGAEVLQICRIGCGGAGLLGVGPGLLVGLLARLIIGRLLLLLRHGVEIERSTLANWVGGACWWLEPLQARLAAHESE